MDVIEERSSAVSLFDGNPSFLADLVTRYHVSWEALAGILDDRRARKTDRI